tara:strand:+ start:2973 stop:3452 length:480 start_codon:yes stop_codon:yes gene_type:complete
MDDKLKQIMIDRVSVSGAEPAQSIIVNSAGDGLEYGNVVSAGGYTGLHDYGRAPIVSGANSLGGPFTGDMRQTFCTLEVTGNISGFTFSNMGEGKTSTIKLINNSNGTGYNLFWDNGIKWIGGSPGAIESGSQALLSLVSYAGGSQVTGQLTAAYAAED